MVLEVTHSPEADLDREIEQLVGNRVRGTFSQRDRLRLIELQSSRARLMRPPAIVRKSKTFYSRRFV